MVASLGQRSRPGPCQLQRFVRVDWSDGQSYGACYGKPAFAYVFKKTRIIRHYHSSVLFRLSPVRGLIANNQE